MTTCGWRTARLRPAAGMVNRWLRELPASGAPAPSSWENYARAVREWAEFLAGHGVGLFDSRERLKSGLSRYAEHRAAGPVKARFAATTWGQHVSILSLFYRWAIAEGCAPASRSPTRWSRAVFAGTGREVRVNLAVRRTPKPHVTIKYLEPDFTELFRRGLRGLAPDGSEDSGFAGRTGPQRRDRRSRAVHRASAGRVHAPAALGDTGAAAVAHDRADPVPVRPGSRRAASTGPRGPRMRPWPGCTTTCSWTGRPRRPARAGVRRDAGASRCW